MGDSQAHVDPSKVWEEVAPPPHAVLSDPPASGTSSARRSGSNISRSRGSKSNLGDEKKKLKKMKKRVAEKEATIELLEKRIRSLEELSSSASSITLTSSTGNLGSNSSEKIVMKPATSGVLASSSPASIIISSPSELVFSPRRPYCFNEPSTHQNTRYSEEGEKILEAATLEKLIEKLTSEGTTKTNPFRPPLQKSLSMKKKMAELRSNAMLMSAPIHKDSSFNVSDELIEEFLHTYTEYTTAHAVVDLLLMRYEGPPTNQAGSMTATELKIVRKKVILFLTRWFEIRPYDFEKDTDLSEKIEAFFEKIIGKKTMDASFEDLPDASQVNDIQHMLAKLKEVLGQGTAKGNHTPLAHIVPDEFACQLTLLEFNLMKQIKSREFLKQRWNKENKEVEAPNLVKAIEWFNNMSSWFSTEIVKEETAEGRKTVIVNLIRVAMKCHALNNYKAIMEVLASLHSHAISCLKHTWELVPSKMIEELDKLGKIMSPKSNYKNYRALLANDPPFVPFVGVFLTDLTFLDDCKTDYTDNLINVDKVRYIGKKIKEFHRFQLASYDIQPNPTIQAEILSGLKSKLFDSNDIYRICKLREELIEEPTQGISIMGLKRRKGQTRKYASEFKTLELTGQEQVNALHTELTERDWRVLLSGAVTLVKTKDEPIIKEGEQNQHIYIITAGRVRVEVFGDDGTSKVVAYLEEDAIFGEMSLFNKSNKATARVSADDPTVELLQIAVPIIYQLFESEPDLAKRFYGALAMIFAKRDRSAAPFQPRIEKAGSHLGTSMRTVVSAAAKPDGLRSGSISLPSNSSMENITRSRSNTTSALKRSVPAGEVVVKEVPCILRQKTIDRSGKLMITQSSINFFSKTFTFETKYSISYNIISAICKKSSSCVMVAIDNKNFLFDLKGERDAVFEIVVSFWKQASMTEQKMQAEISSEAKKYGGPVDFQFEDPLTQDDWNLMLKGAKTVTFGKGEAVINQGELFQRLYHVAGGCCVVDKNGTAVGKIRAGEIFGEISFLDSHGATVSVYADQEEGAELFIIEGYFIRILFNIRPGFAGRFFHYICCLLASRLSR